MPAIKYKVTLSDDEKQSLEMLIRQGKGSSRSPTRAYSAKSRRGFQDQDIIEALDVSSSRVHKTRQRCVEEGPEVALKDRPRPGNAPKLTEKQAAHLIVRAGSDAPEGHDHGTLRLLAGKVVELSYSESCRYETIR